MNLSASTITDDNELSADFRHGETGLDMQGTR